MLGKWSLTKICGLLLGLFMSSLLIKKQVIYNLKIITLLEFKKLQSQRQHLLRRVTENRMKMRQFQAQQAKSLEHRRLRQSKSKIQSGSKLGGNSNGHDNSFQESSTSNGSRLSGQQLADIKQLIKYRIAKESSLNYGSLESAVEVDYSSFNSIYIGVLTCGKYLPSRAGSINATWGNIEYLTSDYSKRKIEYIAKIPEQNLNDYPAMNVNNLMHIDPTLDDRTYPPQQKAFGLLQHICENQLDHYKWYLRADDDVYVDVSGLEKLLDRIDTNRITYLGQPGMGWVEHRDKLGLSGHNFCMGGPGVLFSNALMRRICPHIEKCKREVASLEEDVELGRCVTKYADVECTHSWEGIKRFHHAYDGSYKGASPYSDNDLDENLDIKDSMTLHHVKIPWIMYKVHRYFLKRQLTGLESKGSFDSELSIGDFLDIYRQRVDSAEGTCPDYNKILKFDTTSYYSYDYKLRPLQGSVLEELIHVSEDVYDMLMRKLVDEEINRLKSTLNVSSVSSASAKNNLYINSISGFIMERNLESDKISYVFDVELRRASDDVVFSRRIFVSR